MAHMLQMFSLAYSGIIPNKVYFCSFALFSNFISRWRYIHETDDEVAMVNCPKQQEELIKFPECLCQLQGVNFIKGMGPNHISTCIRPALSEPEAE